MTPKHASLPLSHLLLAVAALLLAEPMPVWKLAATLLVSSGLALNLAWPRLRALWPRSA